MITIIDYGMGNLLSVSNAIRRYTDEVRISSSPEEIASSGKVILPGVGAFKDAVYEIKNRGLFNPILDFINSGGPFMGMCLGLQMLFDKSCEGGEYEGLGLIKGEITGFPMAQGLKVPHMGWNEIAFRRGPRDGACPLLKDVPDKAHMYFVHSYYALPEDEDVIAATTDYGGDFCSFIWKDNIYATQFHPEKSQENGLKIIENFVRL